MATTPTHLNPSALGTKEYWDKLYQTELSNHAENPADEGTVWFDDSDAQEKIVAFLDERDTTAQGDGLGGLTERADARVLDLGCGNGSLLFALADEGWGVASGGGDDDGRRRRRKGRLLGVDYSEQSVELARQVGRARREQRRQRGRQAGDEGEAGGGEGEVEFRVWDVLRGDVADLRPAATDNPPETEAGADADATWDIVLDKGTFDAVSLSAELDARGRRVCEGYGDRVLQLLRPGGIFLVTSCNWTEAELRDWFEVKTGKEGPAGGERLRLSGRIEYRSFSFGGAKGQTISTLCFEKVVDA